MPAPIVVEIYAPQPGPQELAVLMVACSRAAAPNECITSDAKSAEAPLGVAIVRREGERARIELGLRKVVSAEWSTRDLVFQPGDDELERFRAIGFAIGTLVARQVEPVPPAAPASASGATTPANGSKAAPDSAPRDAEPVVTPPLAPEPLEPAPPKATWVDFSGSVGLGLIPGPPRVGGSLRAASELVARGFFGIAGVGYAERVGEPSLRVRWVNMALGVGHPLSPNLRSLGVDVRLLFALERMSVTATDDARSAGDERWKPGVTVGIDGHWDVAAPLSLVLSAETFIDPQRTVIRSGGQRVGETVPLGLNGFVGLRFKLR